MKRTIIEINEDKCVGCGLCASACEQGAIQMINGKAKLVSDSYCDGLGMCLPSCPVDAIKLTDKDVDGFDEERKGFALKDGEVTKGCGSTKEMTFNVINKKSVEPLFNTVEKKEEGCGCGSAHDDFFKKEEKKEEGCGCGSAHDNLFKPAGFKPNSLLNIDINKDGIAPSQLRQWPVQISLVNTAASFFEDSNILIAADCAAYAYANFHKEFIQGRVTVIGCPKLDDLDGYIKKLAEIFRSHKINSVTVARMSVPCCGGLVSGVRKALELSGKAIPYLERTITPDGKLT